MNLGTLLWNEGVLCCILFIVAKNCPSLSLLREFGELFSVKEAVVNDLCRPYTVCNSYPTLQLFGKTTRIIYKSA